MSSFTKAMGVSEASRGPTTMLIASITIKLICSTKQSDRGFTYLPKGMQLINGHTYTENELLLP